MLDYRQIEPAACLWNWWKENTKSEKLIYLQGFIEAMGSGAGIADNYVSGMDNSKFPRRQSPQLLKTFCWHPKHFLVILFGRCLPRATMMYNYVV
jgi:hypothetical protein